VKTANTVEPLGVPSLLNAVEPPDARSKLLPEATAENDVSDTPLPHANVPPLTPQLPLDEVMVKLDVVPESVYVARVWVDHVPRERSPPTVEPPDTAWMVALEGKVPGAGVDVPPGELEVEDGVPVDEDVGEVEPPLFGGYLIPDEGQVPASGASIGTKVPSMMEPFKLKYQLAAFRVLESQLRAGVKPDCAFSAEVSWERVNVLEVLGVIPSFDSQVKVGSVWKSLTTV